MNKRLEEVADYLEMEALDADRVYSSIANLCVVLLRALANREKQSDE